jgi:hypothetical protein
MEGAAVRPMNRLLKAGLAATALMAGLAEASVEVTSFTVNERDGTATATVSLSSSQGAGWLLDYSTSDGSAGDENTSDDYKAAAGTLTFGAGDTMEDVVITIVEDVEIEGDEDFMLDVFDLRRPVTSLNRANAGGENGPISLNAVDPIASGTIGIEDNDFELIVNIAFIGGGETADSVTLTCNSGDVDLTGSSSNSKTATDGQGNTASFGVFNVGPGDLICEATQTNAPPAGYQDTSDDSCDSGFNESSPTCLIENTATTAEFTVIKNTSIGGESEVQIECTSGDVNNTGSSIATDVVSLGNPVVFIVETFTTVEDISGTASDCQISEINFSADYLPEYMASGDSDSVDDDPDNPGCNYSALDSGDVNECAIRARLISSESVPIPVLSPIGLGILAVMLLLTAAIRRGRAG